MEIYVKRDYSTRSDSFYFTDGVNAISENYSTKRMVEHVRFLHSLGIKVESNHINLTPYLYGKN